MIIENEDRRLLDETKRDPHDPIIYSRVYIYIQSVRFDGSNSSCTCDSPRRGILTDRWVRERHVKLVENQYCPYLQLT